MRTACVLAGPLTPSPSAVLFTTCRTRSCTNRAQHCLNPGTQWTELDCILQLDVNVNGTPLGWPDLAGSCRYRVMHSVVVLYSPLFSSLTLSTTQIYTYHFIYYISPVFHICFN